MGFGRTSTRYLEEFLSKSDIESTNILKLISENLTKGINKMVEIIQKLGQKANDINNLIFFRNFSYYGSKESLCSEHYHLEIFHGGNQCQFPAH